MTLASSFTTVLRSFALIALLATATRPAVAAVSPCPADCDFDLQVTVNELVSAVNIALGQAPLAQCSAADRGGDGTVTIDDLLAAVSAALAGCPNEPDPTATATGGPQSTMTPSGSPVPTVTASGSPVPTETAHASTPTSTGSAVATATAAPPTPTTTGSTPPTSIPSPTPTTGATDAPTHTQAPTQTAVASASPTEATEVPTSTPPLGTPTATAAAETATPTATSSPLPSVGPSDLHALIDTAEVRLAWTIPPAGVGYPNSKVLRRLNAPVDGPNDPAAAEVYFGSGSAAAHPLTDLLPSVPETARTYHYAVFGCVTEQACGSAGAAATLTPTLPQALRGGGYVLYWRHGQANLCEDNTLLGTAADPIVPNWWKSCADDCEIATAAQLDDVGIAQASAVGRAFDILGLPVSRVLSSEFCRARSTAELMDFGPTVETDPAITYFVYDESQRCAAAHALLNDPPTAGSNTAIIAHAQFTPPCPVLGELSTGEAAIYKPDGSGGATFVTRIASDDWASYFPPGPSALSASIDVPHMRLTWTVGPAYPVVRLLRRLNAPVDGPYDPDAQLVYSGSGDTLLEPLGNLLPSTPQTPRVYYYAVYGCVGASCEAQGSATMIQPPIAPLLRAGGYTIFWRHAEATVCEDRLDLGTADTTSVPNWWKSCDATCPAGGPVTATARQLDDTGRLEAASIGDQFDDRGFPVGRVISSEFCRAVDTAQLMAFGPAIEQSQALTYFVYDEAARCSETFQLLAQKPQAGTNTALIGHAGNDCTPLSDLAQAQAVIYKPDGGGNLTQIATVNFGGWATLP